MMASIDHIIRLAESHDASDADTLSMLLCEVAQDERQADAICKGRGLLVLVDLARAHLQPLSRQLLICQTIACLSKKESHHGYLFQQDILTILFHYLPTEDQVDVELASIRLRAEKQRLHSKNHVSQNDIHIIHESDHVIEAVLAALTQLAKRDDVCKVIANVVLKRVVQFLHYERIGVQVNAAALLAALCRVEALPAEIIKLEALPALFQLRESSTDVNVKNNARYALNKLGYGDRDPTAEYLTAVGELLNMGYTRSGIDAAIRAYNKAVVASSNPFAPITVPPLTQLLSWMLDHPEVLSPSPSSGRQPDGKPVLASSPSKEGLVMSKEGMGKEGLLSKEGSSPPNVTRALSNPAGAPNPSGASSRSNSRPTSPKTTPSIASQPPFSSSTPSAAFISSSALSSSSTASTSSSLVPAHAARRASSPGVDEEVLKAQEAFSKLHFSDMSVVESATEFDGSDVNPRAHSLSDPETALRGDDGADDVYSQSRMIAQGERKHPHYPFVFRPASHTPLLQQPASAIIISAAGSGLHHHRGSIGGRQSQTLPAGVPGSGSSTTTTTSTAAGRSPPVTPKVPPPPGSSLTVATSRHHNKTLSWDDTRGPGPPSPQPPSARVGSPPMSPHSRGGSHHGHNGHNGHNGNSPRVGNGGRSSAGAGGGGGGAQSPHTVGGVDKVPNGEGSGPGRPGATSSAAAPHRRSPSEIEKVQAARSMEFLMLVEMGYSPYQAGVALLERRSLGEAADYLSEHSQEIKEPDSATSSVDEQKSPLPGGRRTPSTLAIASGPGANPSTSPASGSLPPRSPIRPNVPSLIHNYPPPQLGFTKSANKATSPTSTNPSLGNTPADLFSGATTPTKSGLSRHGSGLSNGMLTPTPPAEKRRHSAIVITERGREIEMHAPAYRLHDPELDQALSPHPSPPSSSPERATAAGPGAMPLPLSSASSVFRPMATPAHVHPLGAAQSQPVSIPSRTSPHGRQPSGVIVAPGTSPSKMFGMDAEPFNISSLLPGAGAGISSTNSTLSPSPPLSPPATPATPATPVVPTSMASTPSSRALGIPNSLGRTRSGGGRLGGIKSSSSSDDVASLRHAYPNNLRPFGFAQLGPADDAQPSAGPASVAEEDLDSDGDERMPLHANGLSPILTEAGRPGPSSRAYPAPLQLHPQPPPQLGLGRKRLSISPTHAAAIVGLYGDQPPSPSPSPGPSPMDVYAPMLQPALRLSKQFSEPPMAYAASASANLAQPVFARDSSLSGGVRNVELENAQISNWLQEHNLGEYIPAFQEQSIYMDTLYLLTENDLENKLGIKKLGDLRRIQQAIRLEFPMAAPILVQQPSPPLGPNSNPMSNSGLFPPPLSLAASGSANPDPASSVSPPGPPVLMQSFSTPAAIASGTAGSTFLPAPVSSFRQPTSPQPQPQSPELSTPTGLGSPPHAVISVPLHVHAGTSLALSMAGLAQDKALHLAFLQSSPLLHMETPGGHRMLDMQLERTMLKDSLNECGRAFRVRFGIATADNFSKMLTKGTRALHISGHGDPQSLVLENGQGGIECLSVKPLRDMLTVGGNELQLVFISACFSSRAALAFVEAGVAHVVAVQESTQVTDSSARGFARHFYMALCRGLTVRQAFNKGRMGVIGGGGARTTPPCCCAHLHAKDCVACEKCRSPACCKVHAAACHDSRACCQAQLPHDESLKFLLLPEHANHDVSLFEDVGEGIWQDCTPAHTNYNLPSLPDNFKGRSKDTFVVVQLVLRSRLSTIVGSEGVGKSALARAVALYINDRNHFAGGVYWIKLRDCNRIEDLASHLASSLQLPLNYNDCSLDEVTLALNAHLRNKHVLFVWDDCDRFMQRKSTETLFRLYLQSFLDHNGQTSVLITAQRSIGRIDGVTHRVYTLPSLHPLDAVFLFVHRFPRDFSSDDFPGTPVVRSLHDLLPHPLLRKVAGNPRLIEWCAELLNYTAMAELDKVLDPKRAPAANSVAAGAGGSSPPPPPASDGSSLPVWQRAMSEESKSILHKAHQLLAALYVEAQQSAPATGAGATRVGVGSPPPQSPQPPSAHSIASSGPGSPGPTPSPLSATHSLSVTASLAPSPTLLSPMGSPQPSPFSSPLPFGSRFISASPLSLMHSPPSSVSISLATPSSTSLVVAPLSSIAPAASSASPPPSLATSSASMSVVSSGTPTPTPTSPSPSPLSSPFSSSPSPTTASALSPTPSVVFAPVAIAATATATATALETVVQAAAVAASPPTSAAANLHLVASSSRVAAVSYPSVAQSDPFLDQM